MTRMGMEVNLSDVGDAEDVEDAEDVGDVEDVGDMGEEGMMDVDLSDADEGGMGVNSLDVDEADMSMDMDLDSSMEEEGEGGINLHAKATAPKRMENGEGLVQGVEQLREVSLGEAQPRRNPPRCEKPREPATKTPMPKPTAPSGNRKPSAHIPRRVHPDPSSSTSSKNGNYQPSPSDLMGWATLTLSEVVGKKVVSSVQFFPHAMSDSWNLHFDDPILEITG
jgi:hypothetical protein